MQALPDEPEITAWVAGFMACRAGLPLIPSAPRVRLVQCAQLSTALPWAMRALALPPLDGEHPIEALLPPDLCGSPPERRCPWPCAHPCVKHRPNTTPGKPTKHIMVVVLCIGVG